MSLNVLGAKGGMPWHNNITERAHYQPSEQGLLTYQLRPQLPNIALLTEVEHNCIQERTLWRLSQVYSYESVTLK
jgi:hypothetical protein